MHIYKEETFLGGVPHVCGGVMGATDIDAFANITDKCYREFLLDYTQYGL